MHEYIHRRIKRQTCCVDTWMRRENSRSLSHAHKHTFPHRSGAWLTAFTSNYHSYRPVRPEEIGGGLAWLLHWRVGMLAWLSHTPSHYFSNVLSHLVLLSPFTPQVLSPFLSASLSLYLKVWNFFFLVLHPHPRFFSFSSWLLFRFMSMWSYCSFIVREMHLFLLSTHTHTHINTHTHQHTHTHTHTHTLKLQGRSLAWGCSCQSNKLLWAGGTGDSEDPPPAGKVCVCGCVAVAVWL